VTGTRPIGLRMERVGMTYAGRNGQVHALDQINMAVRPGEFVCLVGPSGCGKSTLLKLLAGLLRPSVGQIVFDGLSPGGRPHVALVFQEHGLFPWMTVADNVALGLEMMGVSKAERQGRAHAVLEQIGLAAFARHYPNELSGGMRQRAAIARALLTDPRLLLMDEPFSSLDAQSKLVLQEELLRIWKDHGQTVVYVTHDIEEAVLLGDRVLVMSGRPSRIREEIVVPLARPRNLHDRDQPLVRELGWHIWKAIEGEVRQNLHMQA
jgi:NitT/TauT family transport system ATP-binding protein